MVALSPLFPGAPEMLPHSPAFDLIAKKSEREAKCKSEAEKEETRVQCFLAEILGHRVPLCS